MLCSIIISYKQNNDRTDIIKLLNYLSWLLTNEREIILVEQGTTKEANWLKEVNKYNQINYIFIKNEGEFDKKLGYDIGAKNAKSDILIFNDIDRYLKLGSYRYALQLLNRFDIINPYNSICYLNKNSTDDFYKINYNFNILRDNKIEVIQPFCDEIFIIKKSIFFKIKDYDKNDLNDKLIELNIPFISINDICITTNNIDKVKIIEEVKEIKQPISILITAYKSEYFIEECLDSIENQTHFVDNDKYEILVGIDSCEETLKKILDIRHKYRNLRIFMMGSNKGTYVTTNTLLNIAKYDNILRFDSDDIMLPYMIETILKDSDGFQVVKFSYIDFNGTLENTINTNEIIFSHGVVLFRKNVFEASGGYRDWYCGADSELIGRISNQFKIRRIFNKLFYRRLHINCLTQRMDTGYESELRKHYSTLIRDYSKNENIKIERIINEYVEINDDYIYIKKENTPKILNEVKTTVITDKIKSTTITDKIKATINNIFKANTTEQELLNNKYGIMLISFGINYDSIAPICAMSIRKFSDIPILVHTNLPDFIRDKKWSDINNIEFIFHNMQDDENRIIKTQLSKYTKFEKTLYIDVDSGVLSERFLEPFSFLSEYEIVSPKWKTFKIEEIRKKSLSSNKFKKFLKISNMFNITKEDYIGGGVCYFNKNEKTDNFFKVFHELWKDTGSLEDMPGLNGAYFLNKNIVKLLDNKEYNNYNSTIIVSYHDTSQDYKQLKNFVRKRYDDKTDSWVCWEQGQDSSFIKPKICLIYDIMGWAFYIISFNLKKYLNKYYDIDIIRYDSLIDDKKYDCIITYSPNVIPNIVSNKIICGISSLKSDRNLNKLSEYDFAFANNIDLYNKMTNINKYYLENGINTEFFKKEHDKKIIKPLKIGFIASKKWAEHKGIYRIKDICNDNLIKNDIIDLSLVVDTEKKILSQEDMKKYYNDIDIFLISSISETGPNSLLEAMACGVPVITNNVGLAPLIIKNNMNGFIIDDYSDISSYVKYIKKLIDNNDLYNMISNNAIIDIQKWSWENMSIGFKEMIDCYLKNKIK